MEIKRYHWVNTVVGILDSVFYLTDVEMYHSIDSLNKILSKLQIPERGGSVMIPASVAIEAESSFYTRSINNLEGNNKFRIPRVNIENDMIVSIDSWRDMFVNMFIITYPNMLAEEKLLLSSFFNTLLLALGVPDRAASYFPDDVVRAWKNSPESLL